MFLIVWDCEYSVNKGVTILFPFAREEPTNWIDEPHKKPITGTQHTYHIQSSTNQPDMLRLP